MASSGPKDLTLSSTVELLAPGMNRTKTLGQGRGQRLEGLWGPGGGGGGGHHREEEEEARRRRQGGFCRGAAGRRGRGVRRLCSWSTHRTGARTPKRDRREMCLALERAFEEGKARAIG
ncbi:hypothetical protein diail_5560, partial [Diaporthe ilicicola]